jgi:hypothetical protein
MKKIENIRSIEINASTHKSEVLHAETAKELITAVNEIIDWINKQEDEEK